MQRRPAAGGGHRGATRGGRRSGGRTGARGRQGGGVGWCQPADEIPSPSGFKLIFQHFFSFSVIHHWYSMQLKWIFSRCRIIIDNSGWFFLALYNAFLYIVIRLTEHSVYIALVYLRADEKPKMRDEHNCDLKFNRRTHDFFYRRQMRFNSAFSLIRDN